jgi:hypothetical protein
MQDDETIEAMEQDLRTLNQKLNFELQSKKSRPNSQLFNSMFMGPPEALYRSVFMQNLAKESEFICS